MMTTRREFMQMAGATALVAALPGIKFVDDIDDGSGGDYVAANFVDPDYLKDPDTKQHIIDTSNLAMERQEKILGKRIGNREWHTQWDAKRQAWLVVLSGSVV